LAINRDFAQNPALQLKACKGPVFNNYAQKEVQSVTVGTLNVWVPTGRGNGVSKLKK
jgi:hypothetical protein